MKNLNIIGLDTEKTVVIAKSLNKLLANYAVFYQNVRGYHWNIRGEEFFELHEKFEELYNDLQDKIDEIAERILMLGYTPVVNYSEYNKTSSIKESELITEGRDAVRAILASFKIVLSLQRHLLDASGDAADEGTNALMSDYIGEQEKLVWMYSAFLAK